MTIHMIRWCTVVALAAGCGASKPADDCQKFVDKSAPVLRELGKAAGKTIDQKQLDEMATACRKRKADGKDHGKDQGMFDCVLAAADQAAVATCLQGGFTDYASASKKTEADLLLNRLGKGAKSFYVINGAFPVGTAALTPECCAQPGGKCQPDPAIWTGVWAELEFMIDDPYRFRYEVTSTADKLEARAVGDLDCDGETIELKLTVTAPDGTPKVELSPTTGSD
jgi:hypothetical protein